MGNRLYRLPWQGAQLAMLYDTALHLHLLPTAHPCPVKHDSRWRCMTSVYDDSMCF